ncbi:hypothetical protein JCM10207_000580 [Rhodosporidiobolus poonsookiae]
MDKASSSLLPVLPIIAPNLSALEIGSSTRIEDPTALADLVLASPHLQHLAILGQDPRKRGVQPAADVETGVVGQAFLQINSALQAMIAEGAKQPAPLRLRSLVLRNTPIQLASVVALLQASDGGLKVLILEGCELDARGVLLAEEHCPDLRVYRIDCEATSSHKALSTPRPGLPPLELDRLAPLALGSRLTSLELSALPYIKPSLFRLFATPHHAALQSLSLFRCDFSAAHLSHFTSISQLRIVDCSSVIAIPVFVDTTGRPDLGPGCMALKQLCMVGRGDGITLANLWELSMLGRGHEAEEKRRGLQRITVDQTSSIATYNVAGFVFTFPGRMERSSNGSSFDPLPSSLPMDLSPPLHLTPYLGEGILSANLPSLALLHTLLAARNLEEVSIFGFTVEPPPLQALDDSAQPLPVYLAALLRRLVSGGLSLLPLVGSLFTPLATSSTSTSEDIRTVSLHRDSELDLQAGVKFSLARDGLPSPPPPCYSFVGDKPSQRRAPLSAHKRRFVETDELGDEPLSSKRLREEEVEWLLETAKAAGGRLRRVYV